MAYVSALYRFANGDQVGVTVAVENDYPDALDQARQTCIETLREAAVTGICVQEAPDPEPT